MKLSIIYKKNFLSGGELKKVFKDSIRKIAGIISKEEEEEFGSLILIFCSDELIREYNKKYLEHDYETDIITFYDVSNEGLIKGELLISVDTVKENSKRFKVSFKNELMRVIIHGLMHLSGYDDRTIQKKKIMKEKENYYLKQI